MRKHSFWSHFWWILLIVMAPMLVSCQSTKNVSAKLEAVTDVTEADNKIVIAGIFKSGDQNWFINEGLKIEETVKAMGADEFVYIDVQMDNEKYRVALDYIIERKVDGAIICIPDQKLSEVTVQKLNEAGIPFIASDDAIIDASGKLLAPFVGVDGYSVGEMNGDWMANYVIKKGFAAQKDTAVLLMTMNSVSSYIPRVDGALSRFKEMIPTYPDDRIYQVDYDGQTERGFEMAKAQFEAYPGVRKWFVLAANEEGAVGAVRALEELGLDSDSCVIGFGAYLAKNEFKKEYSAMRAASYFSPEAVSGTAARALMLKILSDTPIPDEHLVKAVIVTKENYREIMGNYAE